MKHTREEIMTLRLGFITIGGLIAGAVTAVSILFYDGFEMLLADGVTGFGIEDYVLHLVPFVVAVNLICMTVAFLIYRRLMHDFYQ